MYLLFLKKKEADMKNERMLTTEEISKQINVKLETIRLWLRQGKLKGHKLGPRLWRVPESALQEFIDEGFNQPEEAKRK